MELVRTLQLEFRECGWIADLILTLTHTSFDELYQVYNMLLSHPSIETHPIQVNVVEACSSLTDTCCRYTSCKQWPCC